jgi:hypothetical protein
MYQNRYINTTVDTLFWKERSMHYPLARPLSNLRRRKRLSSTLFVLIAFIFFGTSIAPASAQGQFTGLCTATVDQLNGQGRFSLNGLSRFSLNGLEGANAQLDASDGIPQSLIDEVLGNTIDSTWLLPYIEGWISGNKPSVAPEDTAILIVDDFGQKGLDTTTLPAAQRAEWNQQHLAVYGFPLPDFIQQATHGELVREVVQSLKEELYNSGDGDLQHLADHLWIVEVDISDAAGYQLDAVAAQIRSTVAEYQSSYGINRFIINMSFGLVPCEVQSLSRDISFSFERFQGQRNETPRFVFDVDFEAVDNEPQPVAYNGYGITDFFIDGFGGSGGQDRGSRLTEEEAVRAVGELLSYPSTDIDSGEPEMLQLRTLLSTYLQASADGTMAVIPIAASGNYADVIPDAPLAPAKYPEVVAVGATLGMKPDSREWVYSQPAHMLTPGAWYNFFADGSYSAGTSFAAPYASVLASMYLAFPEVCKFDGPRPPLKNFDYIESTLYYDKLAFACDYDGVIEYEYEMIQNGGFENSLPNGSSDLLPWEVSNNYKDKIRCNKPTKPNVAYADECAYVFKSTPGENSKLKQLANNPAVTYNTGDLLEVSLYGGASDPTGYVLVKLRVGYTDGTEKGKLNLEFYQTTGYQHIGDTFVLDSDSISKIKLQIQNKSQAGKVFIDKVSLKYVESEARRADAVDLPEASQELLPLP